MSELPSSKAKCYYWWIASIAVSVLSCAVLFVLFASYLSELRSSVKNNEDRIAVVQEREDKILAEIEMIRKHATFQPDMSTEGQAAVPGTPGAVEAAPVNGVNPAPAVGGMPSAIPAAPALPPVTSGIPTTVSPAAPVPPVSNNAVHNPVPQVLVPSMPAPSDRK